MRIETALKIRNEALASLKSVYSQARAFGPTSRELHAQVAAVRQSARVKRAPAWVLAFLEGYDKALSDALYDTGALTFGGFVDGAFWSVDRNRPDYYGKGPISAADFSDDGKVTARGHYWAKSLEDTPRPYFLNEDAKEA